MRPPATPRLRPARRSATSTLAVLAVVAAALVAGPRLLTAATSTPAGSPIGKAEHMWSSAGGVQRISGWALDPNTPNPISVAVTVDGKTAATLTASIPRADVAKAYPKSGANHGFYGAVPISEGKHAVCIVAKNVGAGADSTLYCTTRDFDYGPFSHLDALTTRPGSVWVKGWTYDPDALTSPVTVTITIDGRTAWTGPANLSRPDLATAVPSVGAQHGFWELLPMAQGTHQVCVIGTNIGYGSDNTFACRSLTLNESPRGTLEMVAQRPGSVRIAGWTYDPDVPNTPLSVRITIDNVTHTVTANGTRTDVATKYGVGSEHGFNSAYSISEGVHQVCVSAVNVSYGSNLNMGCRSITINFSPVAWLYTPRQTDTGVTLVGWATDPDTSAPIKVRLSGPGVTKTYTANQANPWHGAHGFSGWLPMRSGTQTVCAVAINVDYGSHDSKPACRTVTLAYSPLGRFESVTRAPNSTNLAVTGWTFDPDTTAALSVVVTLDGKSSTITANASRADVAKVYPGFGTAHGISLVLPADDWEHRVCLTVKNVGGGSDLNLGCRVINAVHPTAPAAPQNVSAQAGYGGATVTWTAPSTDGGAPWSKYTVTSSPGGISVTVGPGTTTATVLGLQPSTSYTFSVTATNVAGTSGAAASPAVKTQAAPPPQTSPAPVSTSRYIRNIRDGSAAELATMTAEGTADAKANPSGHGYVVLLDIGGQDEYDGGVVLSATTRFVPYSTLVKDLQSYVDGYHAAQKPSAPVTIAIGTNNDMDVSGSSGKSWADKVVDPLVAYAKRYTGITIAGANDMEPGFRASYSATKSWLSGYLAATSAPFVFNGSADGCSWTQTNRNCNNGWTMSGLYYLSAGAAPIRILNLPQVYNTDMAGQWKYISLTGVTASQPRINFAGTLTEWTACDQSRGCGSLTGNSAWSTLWKNLQSDTRLKVGSLPYSTDLRIDK